MNEQEELQLKPCPFCGENARIVESNDIPEPYYRIYHACKDNRYKDMRVQITIKTCWFKYKKDAIKTWNDREDNQNG